MSYAQIVSESIRLIVLQFLEEEPDYAQNEGVIKTGLGVFGHHISRDKLHTELSWLSEQGLVTLDTVSGVLVVKLTQRGEDVALGYARVPGVARPSPRA